MSENRILELLARKKAKEATEAELSELEYLLGIYPDGLYYEEVFDQLWIKKESDNTDAELDAAYMLHRMKHPDSFEPYETDTEDYSPRGYKRMLVLASVFLCVLLLGAGSWYGFYGKQQQVGATEIFAGKGIRKKVVLPDGTKVWLNCNSRLSFNDDLKSGANRVVHLEGEAFFDVTKNKHRPFVIYTNKFSIKVLGTAFNVKAYPGEKHTEATLIRGLIELTVADAQKQKILLKPNEKFTLTDTHANSIFPDSANTRNLAIEGVKPVEIQSQQYIEETSWVDNKLIFKNESFEELLPKLERWYNVSISVQNNKLDSCHFTGVFQNESLDQALRALQLIKPFKYEIKYDEVTIK